MCCRFLLLCSFLATFLIGSAQQFSTIKINVSPNSTLNEKNALLYLPPQYDKNKSYPLVIYSHALSQAGASIEKLYTTGLPKVLKDGYRPSFDFIMVAPQSPLYSLAPDWLQGILQNARKQWKIDTNRVYLTGIDAGGWAAYGSQLNVSAAFAKKIAAIVTISAAAQNVNKANLNWWQGSKTPLWTIQGDLDKSYLNQNSTLVDALNKSVPGLATLTIRPGTAHDGWDAVYKGDVKLDGKTMWDWLYQYDRTKAFSKPHATALESAAMIAGAESATATSGYVRYEAEKYTSMNGVRTQTTSDAGGGLNVGWIDYNDWMNYSITVSTKGTYAVKLRLAAKYSGGKFQIKNSSGTVLATVSVPNTGGYQTWTTVNTSIPLAAGTQTIRLQSVASTIWNINWFEVGTTPLVTTTSTTGGTMLYTGTHIEAENTASRSGVLNQSTSDFAGGYQNIFDVNYGDWMSYKVNAPASGYYTLCFRMACDATGSRFQVKNESGTVLTTVDVPSTGSWQAWRDVTAVINLSAGSHTLKLQSVSSTGWNLNYFEVTKTPLNPHATYTLRPNSGTSIYLPLGLNLAHLKPGDTLYINKGAYNVIDLGKFKGSASYPVIIRNKGGQVTCKIIRFSNTPEHFRLLGNGSSSVTYGFKIDGLNSTGSCLTAFGTDFEIAYVEGSNSNSGFFIKKNPSSDDPQTVFPNYLMDNIRIHHNYIHNITGEGMYIGHTAPDGGQNGNPLIPVRMRNVDISYNRVNQTGYDGIQLSNATTGCKIHHNTVTNFGTRNTYGQQAGIILGGNTQGNVYNNTIKYGTGNGIQNFGFGLNKIYSNYMEKVGRNGTDKGYEGVYCNDVIIKSESRPKQQIEANSNTILYPMPWGAIRVSGYNDNSLPATMQYNKLLLPSPPSDWQKKYFPTYVPNSTISGNTLISQ